MSASNLPPGCSESDIPGNRPEDEEWWAFVDALHKKTKHPLPEPDDDDAWEIIREARDLGYQQGFSEGKDEVMMELGAREMARVEELEEEVHDLQKYGPRDED